jgi:hypothetical protein
MAVLIEEKGQKHLSYLIFQVGVMDSGAGHLEREAQHRLWIPDTEEEH